MARFPMMKPKTPESHSEEQPEATAPRRCGACGRRRDLRVALGVALLTHFALLPSPVTLPGILGVAWLYASGLLFGLGRGALVPELNPQPVRSGLACLVLAGGALFLGVMTLPDPGACIPEPGLPGVALPALALGTAFFLLGAHLLCEGLRRGLGDLLPRDPLALAAQDFAVGALVALATLAGLVALDGHPAAGLWMLPPATLCGAALGAFTGLRARPEGSPS